MLELTPQRYKNRIAIGERPDMLIDEEFRKCVTFLFVDKPDPESGNIKRVPAATAFLVGIEISSIETVIYAVTARHIIDSSRTFPLFIRFNTRDGGFKDVQTDPKSWVCHPSTDVAANRVELSTDTIDLKPLPFSILADDEYVNHNGVGAGDDVFFVGLFSQHPGQNQILPIIRFGNVSLMPREKIEVKMDLQGTTAQIDAYLMEARSWGGQSGSPVFIYYPPDRTPGITDTGGAEPKLLGLVHGHYDISQPVAFSGDIFGSGKVPVNAGIAIVVPSQKIIDLLMGDELADERKSILEESQGRRITPNHDTDDPAD